MSKTQSELLKLQTTSENQNGNKSPLNSQLVNKEPVEGTGFDIVGNEELGYFVALGKYRITEPTTKDHCYTMIQEKDYSLLLGLIGAVIESNLEYMKDTVKTINDQYSNV